MVFKSGDDSINRSGRPPKRTVRRKANAFREMILDSIGLREHEVKSLTFKELCQIASSIIPKENKLELDTGKKIDIKIQHNYTDGSTKKTDSVEVEHNDEKETEDVGK